MKNDTILKYNSMIRGALDHKGEYSQKCNYMQDNLCFSIFRNVYIYDDKFATHQLQFNCEKSIKQTYFLALPSAPPSKFSKDLPLLVLLEAHCLERAVSYQERLAFFPPFFSLPYAKMTQHMTYCFSCKGWQIFQRDQRDC